ncbi:hypothetical protein ACTFJW_18440 [Clostridium cagae]|uniref:hypothetical protein n=1 Tax=Clostridium cagae TaxID=2080751 RepID=UPI003F7611AC
MSEYVDTIKVTVSNLKKMKRAQGAIFDYFTGDLDDGQLGSDLSAVSSILGILFYTSSVAGIVSLAAGLVGGLLSSSDKKTLQNQLLMGYMDMDQKIDYLEDNNMDMAEIKFPFAKYLVDGKKVTFVIGRGIFGSFHPKNGGGWMTKN